MTTTREKLQRTPLSRVFTIEGGAGPQIAPVYQGLGRAGALSWNQGDITPVRVPSPNRYDQFDIVTTIQAQQGLPTMPVEVLRQIGVSQLLALAKRRCVVDVQVHVGVCKNPSDFDGGWGDGFVGILEGGHITAYNIDAQGALDSNQNAVVMETIPFTGLDYYEVHSISPTALASSLITDEVVDVAVCDAVSCGDCGLPSDGNNVVFALVNDSSGSPGIAASVVWTNDGWATSSKSILTGLTIGTNPTSIICMGAYLVVFSNNGLRHLWTRIADLVAGTAVWTAVTSGYVSSKGPNSAVVLTPALTLIAGDGGYIYKMTDPTAAVTVQTAGDQTVQNLRRIRSFGDDVVVAVGASNVVLASYNRGITWALITGPSGGVSLGALAIRDITQWIVGNDSGSLYYTLDGGNTWTSIGYSGVAGTGIVSDVAFATRSVGYLAWYPGGPAATSAKLYRTVNGGHTWNAVPDGGGAWPTFWRINAIAPGADANTVFVGGLATDGNDGVLYRVA